VLSLLLRRFHFDVDSNNVFTHDKGERNNFSFIIRYILYTLLW